MDSQSDSYYFITFLYMLPIIYSYISWLLTLLVVDGVMIWFVILPTFKKYIPTYLNTDMNFIAAIAFYLFYILVILLLVILPWVEYGISFTKILINSALFGFGAYMTYELTSMSVMKWWSWEMVAIDTIWWTILTVIIGGVMYQTYKFFI